MKTSAALITGPSVASKVLIADAQNQMAFMLSDCSGHCFQLCFVSNDKLCKKIRASTASKLQSDVCYLGRGGAIWWMLARWRPDVLFTIMCIHTQKFLSYTSYVIFRTCYSLSVCENCLTYMQPMMIEHLLQWTCSLSSMCRLSVYF